MYSRMLDKQLEEWLAEDVGSGDLTSEALLPAEAIKSTMPRIIPIIRKYTQLIAAALSYCWSENTDCI